MTPEQEAAMKVIYVRADQNKLTARVNTLGIPRPVLVSLNEQGYLILNSDNTVTLTQGGAYAVRHLPPAAGASPARLDPDRTDPDDQDDQDDSL